MPQLPPGRSLAASPVNRRGRAAPRRSPRAGTRSPTPAPDRRSTRWLAVSTPARSPSSSRRAIGGVGIRAGRRRAAPSALPKAAFRHRLGRDAVQRPLQAGGVDGVQDQPHDVVAVDPGHVLPPATDGPAGAQLERRQQLRQRPALARQHDAGAQGHGAHTGALRGRLPVDAEPRQEVVAGGAVLGQQFVAARPVDADGGAGDEHGRLLGRGPDRGDDPPGRVDAALPQLPLARGRPALVGDAGPGQMHHRVRLGDSGREVVPGSPVDVAAAVGPGRARDAGHVIAARAQRPRQRPADRPARARHDHPHAPILSR